MFRKHELVPSVAMGRKVHLWRYGHYGMPILVFPSAAGMAHEWDAHGMVDALADLIDAGKIKLYCTESNVAEAWTRKEGTPQQRMARHIAFEKYINEELTAMIRKDCKSDEIPIAVTGTSLGAFYSANFALKNPRTFQYALCMSGRYDATWLTDGYTDGDIYFNNPVAFVPGLDGESLDAVREHTHLALVCGQGRWEDGNIEDTQRLASLLAAKEIPHECDMWGRDSAHQWEWWQRQALLHLGRRFG